MATVIGTGEEWKEVATKGMAAYAAPSLFQPHKMRQAIRDAHEKKIPPMVGTLAGIPSPAVARLIAPLGFDSIWMDWEHTSMNTETMTDMVHNVIFMSQGRSVPWVRVPGHDHASIGYALDAGASIVVPQVETVEDAKHVMAASKYGTRQNGNRSAPPFRLIPGITDTTWDGSGDIHKCVNGQAAVMIQVESAEAVRNLDDILTACPDIDVVWLGSLDCRVSMNLPALGGGALPGATEPEWLEIKKVFFDTLKKHDKPYAGFAFLGGAAGGDGEQFKEKSQDMSMMTISADLMAIAQTAGDAVQARKLFGEIKPEWNYAEGQK